MMNIRYRERTNTWPGFVDLFSNLVIILIFLLIVFLVLWTTTSVFNKHTGVRAVAELKETNAHQAEIIQQMTADEQEAARLLMMARVRVQNLESNNEQLAEENGELTSELHAIDLSIEDLIAAYEAQIAALESRDEDAQALVAQLEQQLNMVQELQQQQAAMTAEQIRAMNEQYNSQYVGLQQQLAQLQAALDAAEERAAAQDVQYTEMSTRLNKALADKVAELNKMQQYQSDFYRAVKTALGDRTTIRDDGDRFIVSSDILFPSGSYKLSDAGRKQLSLIAGVIKDLENKIPSDVNWIIRVDGHTDKKPVLAGTRGYKNNTELSLLRATAVADALASYGVSKRRLVPSGFGEMHPTALGDDATSLQQNRRIELQLTNR